MPFTSDLSRQDGHSDKGHSPSQVAVDQRPERDAERDGDAEASIDDGQGAASTLRGRAIGRKLNVAADQERIEMGLTGLPAPAIFKLDN
jgi:hypothetical protein